MARIITDRNVSAAHGLATDEVLMGSTSLHLYTYEGAALVGRYQDLEANVDLEWCAENDIEVNRRLTGGGGILMTPDQLGIALTLNREEHDLPRSNEALFKHFGRAITGALAEADIDAQSVPKNDIVADGRKIAGLGLWERSQEVQFHCSLLVDMDVEKMLKALEMTEEKLSDKHIQSFEERITTVTEQAGVGIDQMQESVAAGFEKVLDIDFTESSLTDEEAASVEDMVEERYDTDEWRYLIETDATEGQAVQKTDGGLLRVYTKAEDDTLAMARVTGDFFTPQDTVNQIESALKWTPLERDELTAALADVPSIEGIDDAEIVETVLAAATDHTIQEEQ